MDKERLELFIKKLKEKRQSSEQQQQAVQAIRLFYQIDSKMLPQTGMGTPQPEETYHIASSHQSIKGGDCGPSKFSDQRQGHLGKADFYRQKRQERLPKNRMLHSRARENCQSEVRPLPKFSQLL